MPTIITLATGKWLHVMEGPDHVHDRIVASGGGLTRFDVLSGDDTRQVFVNPAHVVSFQEERPSVYEQPFVDVIPEG